ncbi:nitrate reductase [Vibrio cincinnatiensis]|uniref:chaperone NapD n=1 Tax=Vibrio cincinnatiensis TaxID=675 RepID=UPI001EDE18DF|nr:chaperone NapD [Vibrio cincinnatiensis]MCG3767221.1 nitrate reductase [Vibrio cincinnatiensis]
MSLNEVHISSLIVHTLPEHLDTVKAQINDFEQAEIYGDSPEGKVIVVLETESQGFVTETIDAINNLPHVLSVVLVYHQIDTLLPETNINTGNPHSQLEGDV